MIRPDMSSDELRADLQRWGREPALSELDALMWRTDRHPSGAWSGVVVQLLDRVPDWERLRAAHEWFVQIVPRFAQRVVDPALPVGPPMWEDDPCFDLDFHLRRVSLPTPGTHRQLMELAQTIALTPLDRSRPPWEGHLVEGLANGGAAYVMHAHHVFMDGLALAQLHERVLNVTREHQPSKLIPPHTPTHRGPMGVAALQISKQIAGTPGALREGGRMVTRAARDLRATGSYMASLARVAAPPPANPSQILRGGSQRKWRFETLECEFGDLRRASKSAGGSLNDAFVCALLGGLRRYCAAQGEELEDVPISMPVAMRTADQATGGNQFAAAYLLVPSGIADPRERIRAMHKRVDRIRSEPALNFLGVITPILNRTPSRLAAAILGSVGGAVLTTSSWPGISEDRYMAGARFDRMFVFAPLPGTVLTAAMCTHRGVCCIAMNADGDVFEDLDLLWKSMQEGLDEILALG
ncbi:diacylglycerol O-acyltransferase [Mycobacterium antarcticum]|nr:diacylglycerol O-acyltransferase [Mycolicibacterium sp. TUM20985]GLP82934.1 diacylglycerol O-acyltransferase [Mycolicibacterium sp. TUM20984]